MRRSSLEIHKLTPTVGAEVRGVELANVDPQEIAAIRHALLDNGVLFFRNQELSPISTWDSHGTSVS